MCIGKKRKKGASPGIEPGPLAPEANIIPLNYEAVQVRSLEEEYKGKGEWEKKEKKGVSEKESSVGQSESVKVKSSVSQVRKKKKKRSDPGGGRTHDLSLRRRMRFHCATGPSMKTACQCVIKVFGETEKAREQKRGFAGNRTRATRTLSGYFTT